MRRILTNYFYYSKSERNGVIVLILLTLAAVAASRFFSTYQKAAKAIDYSAFETEILAFHNSISPSESDGEYSQTSTDSHLFHFNPNTATIDEFVQLGLSVKVATIISHYREAGGKFFKKDDFKKIYGLKAADYSRLEPYIEVNEGSQSSMKYTSFYKRDTPQYNVFNSIKLVPFDPNTADENTLLSLGLEPKVVKNVLKYRLNGGKFYKKEDFKKTYGLSDIDFLRIENYIQLPDIQKNTNYNFEKVSSKPLTDESSQKPSIIDINSATEGELLRLRGIGTTFANRILKQREDLGGFATIEQLREIHGLPDSTFRNITPYLKLSTPVYRKIFINKIETTSHPYLSRKQVEILVRYRMNHGSFKNMDDLRKAGIFTEVNLDKLKMYISFD